ncbi:MAG: hypothetical protein ACNA8W_14395, partial [Bradymonadaceae bacterium]
VTIHSDIGIGDESVPRVETDSTPVLQMLPSGDGLLVPEPGTLEEELANTRAFEGFQTLWII